MAAGVGSSSSSRVELGVGFTVKGIVLDEEETIEVRGSGPVLNWGRGIPLGVFLRGAHTSDGKGIYMAQEEGLFSDTEYKFMINGRELETGPNHRVSEGETALRFGGRGGIVDVYTYPLHQTTIAANLDYDWKMRDSFFFEAVDKIFKELSSGVPMEKQREESKKDFTKRLFETLSEDMQRKIGWNIYVANGKSTVYQGVDRKDIGRWVIENAPLSPLAQKGMEKLIFKNKINSILSSIEFLKDGYISETEKSSKFPLLLNKVSELKDERIVTNLVALFQLISSPINKITILADVIRRASQGDALMEGLGKELYRSLPEELQGKIKWNIYVANGRNSTYAGAHRGDLGQYVVTSCFSSKLCLDAVNALLREQKVDGYLSQMQNLMIEWYSDASRAALFRPMFTEHPGIRDERISSRFVEAFRLLAEPKNQIQVLSDLLQKIQVYQRNGNESKRAIMEELGKEFYRSLPESLQGKIRWNIYVANGRSSTYAGEHRGDLGQYVVNECFSSPLCAKAVADLLGS